MVRTPKMHNNEKRTIATGYSIITPITPTMKNLKT
jgi:hypothetical protein